MGWGDGRMNFDTNDLAKKDYWYVTTKANSTVLWNASLSKGWVPTMSMVRLMPGLENAVALHDLQPMLGTSLEQVWEVSRQCHFPQLLPRAGAMFLFDDANAAQVSGQVWFKGKETVVVNARVHKSGRIHRGHLGWFEEIESEWPQAARQYWAGDENPRPPGHWENVVHGALYFPDWEREPFGKY